jgi:hypothetical protein
VDVETWVIPLFTLAVGALLSGVGTYAASRNKLRFDYDAHLREKRVEVYVDLWRRLEPLAKYARTSSFTDKEVAELASSLRIWYFQKGGIFLSVTARGDYFAMQEALARLAGGWGWASPDRQQLTPAAWEYLRVYGSQLRTSLTRDVGTRASPRLPGNAEPFDRSLAGTYIRDDGRQLVLRFQPRIVGGGPRLVVEAGRATAPRAITVLDWTPAQSRIRALLDDPDGGLRERILFVEPGQLVEGPPLDDEAPIPAVLWKRVCAPRGAE